MSNQLVGVSNTSPSNASASPNDHNIGPSAGNDGISSLVWSPLSNLLVSTNWDGGVRCWEVQEQAGHIRSIPKAQGEYSLNARVCSTILTTTTLIFCPALVTRSQP
jgi:mRNA export factor